MKHLSAFLAAILLAATALAATAARANPYGDMIEMRLLPGWRAADGSYVAGLELRLAPGWKTYWRAPGDAGVPPLFDWSASRNLSSLDISWPTPDVFTQNGMRTIGYKNRVVLPLTIAPRRGGKPVRLLADIDIGICNEVCVPMRLRLDETLTGAATRPDPVIAAALAERPFSASEAGLRAITCTLSPVPGGAGIALRAEMTLPPTGGSEVAVIETNDPLIWASEPQLTRHGNTLVAQTELQHASGGAFALDRSGLRFTILGRTHAVDILGCDAS